MSVVRALRDFVLLPADPPAPEGVEPDVAPPGAPAEVSGRGAEVPSAPPGGSGVAPGPAADVPSEPPRGSGEAPGRAEGAPPAPAPRAAGHMGFLPPLPGGGVTAAAESAPSAGSAAAQVRTVPASGEPVARLAPRGPEDAERPPARRAAPPPARRAAPPRAVRHGRPRSVDLPPADGVGVLCRTQDAHVLAAVVAGALRRLHRAPCAVALVWRTAPRPPAGGVADPLPGHWIAPDHDGDGEAADPRGRDHAPRPEHGSAARPARRLATSLGARGVPASASGRIVTVALPSQDGQAAQGAEERARAAVGDVPVVLVVAGPRDAWADAALRRCRHVLVATDDGRQGVADLARAQLASRGLTVAPLAVPRGLARPLCVRGLLQPASARAALATLTTTTSGAPA